MPYVPAIGMPYAPPIVLGCLYGQLVILYLFYSATRIKLLLLSAYIASNSAAIALEATKGPIVASSATLAASINLVLLLLRGYISRITDVVIVSYPIYYSAYYQISYIPIIKDLVYTLIGLNVVAWGQAFDLIALSGCIISQSSYSEVPKLTIDKQAAGSFLIVLLLSFLQPRHILGAAFYSMYRILYFVAIGSLAQYVLLIQSVLYKVLVFMAYRLQLLLYVYRVIRRQQSAEVTERQSDLEVTRLRLRT